MIPAEFDYHAPGSVKEAVALLSATQDAKVLAGGMSLIPALKHRLASPAALVDIGRVAGLDGLSERRGRVAVGARVTHAEVGRSDAAAEHPVLCELAEGIGDVQVRNRGTLGGSLVHADPAADWPALFLALDGEADVVGPGGERTVAARDFFTGMLTSAVGEGELLVEVRLGFERKRAGAAYTKMRQAASGFAVVGVAAQVVLDRRGRLDQVGVAITGVNPVPFRATSLESALAGTEPDDAALREACSRIEELDPMGDVHASADYRRHVVAVYARRALLAAAQRAR